MPHPCMSLHHQDVTLTERVDDWSLEVDLEAESLSNWNRVKIRKLEREIEHLSELLDLGCESDGDRGDCCAHLEGEFVEYFVPRAKRETAIGRGEDVDVDLTSEINSSRIHRRHCLLRAVPSDSGRLTFSLRNVGQRPVAVNGLQLLMDDETPLTHNSLIQIQTVTLLFRVLSNGPGTAQDDPPTDESQLSISE